MNLQQMTVDELTHWLSVLTAELARRAAPPPAPQPRAPWEMGRAQIEATREAVWRTGQMPDNGLAPTAPPDINAVIAAAVAREMASRGDNRMVGYAPPRSFADVGPPPMLAGQQRPPPGTVLTTRKTDPELAAKFAAVPERPDIGVDANGRVIADTSGFIDGMAVDVET